MRTVFKLLCICVLSFSIHFSEAQNEVQRVRIDFENPEGYTRHLLLGFLSDNSATDGFDYGYDALNGDDFPDDLNWIIDDNRCVIQGVGSFDMSKYYPLGMFLTNTGNISIALADLENFDETIDVYLYDSELDTYTHLNAFDYTQNLESDIYLERFYITFSTTAHLEIINNSILSTNDSDVSELSVRSSKLEQAIYIKGNFEKEHTSIALYSLDGKKIINETFREDVHVVNTSEISGGIYILKIDNRSNSYSTKVCISN